MFAKRLGKIRSIHSLQMIVVLVLFLSANLCNGITFFEEKEANLALIAELSQADKLELEMVFSDIRPNRGEGWTQGFTVTDQYFIVVATTVGKKNTMTAYDKKTFEKVKTVECDIGHGNDLTFNDNTNEIVALGGENNEVRFFDADTLEEMPERQIELGTDIMPAVNASGITYSSDFDEYYLVSPKTGIRVWGGDFLATNITYNINSAFNLYQTLSYHKGYLLYSRGCHLTHGICGGAQDGEIKDLETKKESYAPSSGAVIMYDARTGQRDAIFSIPPMNKKGEYYGEFEGASVDEKNNIYFVYSSYYDDHVSVGDNGSFVVFRLAKNSKAVGNKKLQKMLNRNLNKNQINSGIMPLRKNSR